MEPPVAGVETQGRGVDGRTLTAILITLALWGTAFPGIRASLQVYAPGHVALLRFLAASAILAVYALLTRMRLPERQDIGLLLLLGLVGVAGYHATLNHGLVAVTAGPASMLVNTAPVFTALLAVRFLGERVAVRGWIGLGMSLCGAVLISLGEGRGLRLAPEAFLLLAAALSTSLGNVMQKPLLLRYSPLEVSAWSIWIGTLCLMAFSPGLIETMRSAPLGSTLLVLYLGIFPIAVVYVAWAYVLSQLPASRAVSILYLLPVVATLTGWLWLREIPALLSLAGGLLALSGVVIVNVRRENRAAASPPEA